MGGNQSNLVPMPFGFDYMTIAFRYTDRIRMFYATDQEINIVREIIQRNWRGELHPVLTHDLPHNEVIGSSLTYVSM